MPSVSSKGQVTIPKSIRDKLGIKTGDEIEFIEESGRVFILKKSSVASEMERFKRFAGKIKYPVTGEELITELRGEKE